MTGGSHSGAPADLDLRFHDWRALIEQLPMAVYIDRLDEWSSNLYTSPQMEAILGYSPEEWTSDDHLLLRVVHPDDRDRVMAAHWRSCETGEPFRMEYRMIARDGRVVWFLDHATVVPRRSGAAGVHHGFLLDITECKALEAELAERTEQLQLQEGYLESLLEISPVAIVTTAVDDALANGRAQAFTKRTHNDGSLIDLELLAVPVVVGGQAGSAHERRRAVRQGRRHPGLLQDRGRRAGARAASARPARVRRGRPRAGGGGRGCEGLDVACLVDPKAPAAIVGDSTRLRQILANLLTNAVKFTEHGEVVLTVESQGRDRLHFAVRDTGIGIPADRIDRLFRSFSQVDGVHDPPLRRHRARARDEQGAVRDDGRGEWAESEPGKGSAFHFSVRAAPAVGAAPWPVAAELRGKRLLIVDDNAANREAVASHARSWGMVPRDTGSPAQALEWIRYGDPLDVAVLDMQMPEMDGLALACEIRCRRDRDALPLVISPRSHGGSRVTKREASCSRPYEADQGVAAAHAVAAVVVHRPPASRRRRRSSAIGLRRRPSCASCSGRTTRSTGGRPSRCWRSLAPGRRSS
jgi:PAS domain S-box-containing protein